MPNRHDARARLAVALICSCALLLGLSPRTATADGATIWGEDYASTVKAMKTVMRALGVKSCLHCHVKGDGRVDYEAETAHKQIARSMKFTFVDSLLARGQGEVVVTDGDRSSRIAARYRAAAEDAAAAILLTVRVRTTGADSSTADYQGRIELAKDTPLDCATCHDGKLHFLTQAEP